MTSVRAAILMASAACLAQDIELHASYPTIRRLRAAEKKDPKALGVAYYQAGQHLLFRQQMEQAMAADPRDHMPHYLLGRHFDSDLQDFDRAAAYFLASLERNPKHALSRAHLGHTLEMRGLRAEAVEAYSQATAIQPCLPFAVAGLARLGSATVELMRKTLECGGDDVMLLRALAKAVSDAEAAVYLERALVLDPSNSALAYQVHRSWFAAGDAVKAAAALEVYRKLHDIYGGR